LSALFIYDVAEKLKNREGRTAIIAAAAFFLVAFIHLSHRQLRYMKMTPVEISVESYGPLFADAYKVGRELGIRTKACEKIYQWGAEPGVYYYSGRDSASDIFFSYPIYLESFEKRSMYFTRVYDDLTADPPAFFVWNKVYEIPPDNILYQFIMDNYDFRKQVGIFHLFEYKNRKTDCR